jgi:hypothetical protein
MSRGSPRSFLIYSRDTCSPTMCRANLPLFVASVLSDTCLYRSIKVTTFVQVTYCVMYKF